MNKRIDFQTNNTTPRQHGLVEIAFVPELAKLFDIPYEERSDLIIVEKAKNEKLISYLKTEIASSEQKLKLIKEIEITTKRRKQLQETKDIVYSLRETDKTSDTALDFLKERLELLQKEREDVELTILASQEKLEKISTENELKIFVVDFISQITFLNTDDWDKDLDYFRTRFLLQREQEEDQKLKEDFIEKDEVEIRESEIDMSYQFMKLSLAVHKKYFSKIKSLSIEFNKLVILNQKSLRIDINTNTETEIENLTKEQEKESFEIGKELYGLKREQGILTLKIYEIVQTLKSRLLNITGSMASRRFMKEAFNDIKRCSEDPTLTFYEKKDSITKEVARLLRIVRKQPSEGS